MLTFPNHRLLSKPRLDKSTSRPTELIHGWLGERSRLRQDDTRAAFLWQKGQRSLRALTQRIGGARHWSGRLALAELISDQRTVSGPAIGSRRKNGTIVPFWELQV